MQYERNARCECVQRSAVCAITHGHSVAVGPTYGMCARSFVSCAGMQRCRETQFSRSSSSKGTSLSVQPYSFKN